MASASQRPDQAHLVSPPPINIRLATPSRAAMTVSTRALLLVAGAAGFALRSGSYWPFPTCCGNDSVNQLELV